MINNADAPSQRSAEAAGPFAPKDRVNRDMGQWWQDAGHCG
jgi:hypothetical protein